MLPLAASLYERLLFLLQVFVGVLGNCNEQIKQTFHLLWDIKT